MLGKDVRLDGMAITYPNGFTAVNPTDLTVDAGVFFSILGPSGCGKTTILRAISGFIQPSKGSILIGGQSQLGIGPNRRSTSMIFQNLALFPLMSVLDNVAFGLEAQGLSVRARRAKAEELLSMVALSGQEMKKPTELSGGQRQRVAIARALAVEPAVLLLDEPLSALDLKLRQHMRTELRAIQKKSGVTFIYITHDQGEALTMSDRIAVMNDGIVEQVGTGDDIYSSPLTPFAASFVGEVNVFCGKVIETHDGQARVATPLGAMVGANPNRLREGAAAMLFVRPEHFHFDPPLQDLNCFDADVIRRDMEGPFVTLALRSGDHNVTMHLTNMGKETREITGRRRIGFDPQRATILAEGKLARTGQEMAAT